ncbi:MAG: hypothetical protein ABJH98_03780 [Reichenbachiella sp.]|uniref:hypothetical protein n=1 Tax=Reichenbachiella sp. TaxID=2184521 RepID=UPI0032988B35
MSNNKIVSQNLTKKLKGSVISAHRSTQLEDPIFAINWFNLKRIWLYELYNRLVIGQLKSIGGSPIFKGRLQKIILDNDRLRRDMLLIVKYPKAQAFLDLISSKIFQIKSLLRSSSVIHFQFGFMQKINSGSLNVTNSKYKGKLKYLVHVCENSEYENFQDLIDRAASMEVFPHFIGQKSAMLGLQKKDGKLRTLDFVLSHVLVFSGFDTDALEGFTRSAFYQEFVQTNKNNFIGIYDRKI